MRTIHAEIYRTLIMIKRNYFKLFDITVWPIILFFAVTLFLKFVSPKPEIMVMAITGLMGWRAVYHFQIESNINYMDEYWSKNTSQILASPTKISQFITASIITAGIKFLIVLSLYLICAYALFDFQIVDIGLFILGIVYLCFTGTILGLITFATVILYKDKAITFSFMLPDLFVLLSGVYYPISIFPDFIIKFVHVLPTFYGFELLKSMVGLGTANYVGMIGVGLIWFVASLLILKYAIKKARKDGSFSNYD